MNSKPTARYTIEGRTVHFYTSTRRVGEKTIMEFAPPIEGKSPVSVNESLDFKSARTLVSSELQPGDSGPQIYIVGLNLGIQGGGVHAQQAGGAGLVAAGLVQGAAD